MEEVMSEEGGAETLTPVERIHLILFVGKKAVEMPGRGLPRNHAMLSKGFS